RYKLEVDVPGVTPEIGIILFSDAALTTGIHPLSLHDALPISPSTSCSTKSRARAAASTVCARATPSSRPCSPSCRGRACAPSASSEEHTSELQSRVDLVWSLLLESEKRSARLELSSRTCPRKN